MTESQRICEELDRQAMRDRGELQNDDETYLLPAGTYSAEQLAREVEKAAVVALCKAEQAHHRYSRAGSAIKQAIMELEIVLYPYEEEMRHHNYRSRERQAMYDYTRAMFQRSLAELRAAQKLNSELGEFTERKVATATSKVNPDVQKEMAAQIIEADQATKFCESYLTWITNQPPTGESNVNRTAIAP